MNNEYVFIFTDKDDIQRLVDAYCEVELVEFANKFFYVKGVLHGVTQDNKHYLKVCLIDFSDSEMIFIRKNRSKKLLSTPSQD